MEQKRKRKRKQKKKKSKLLLYILLVFGLIILGAGGYLLYELKFKQYDVADPQVNEIIEDTYVLELPDGTEVVVDSQGNIVEQKTSNNGSTNQTSGNSQDSIENVDESSPSSTPAAQGEGNTSTTNENTNTSNQSEASKPTVASIKEKYAPTVNALEAQADARINSLLSSAASEYATKKANGEAINVGYFYSKYSGAAQGLEASTDAAFNSLIGIIEQDLEANGFDKSHAQSFRDQYEAAKKARQDALLSKAKEFM